MKFRHGTCLTFYNKTEQASAPVMLWTCIQAAMILPIDGMQSD
jgi:hypothetical protein